MTLVEVMLATGVFLVAVTGILFSYSKAIQLNGVGQGAVIAEHAVKNKIEEINIKIQTAHAAPGESFVDNQQFLQLMQVSKRTAQTWRIMEYQ